MNTVQSPYPQFFDTDGTPLDDGLVYVGIAGENPETSPLALYWDEAKTQPAAQPIRTRGGYAVRHGSIAQIYVESDSYSMTCKTSAGKFVFTHPDVTAIASLRADLASTLATKGPALLGFNWDNVYPDDTVGNALVSGSNLVNVLRFIPPEYHAAIRAGTHTTPLLHTYIQAAADSAAYGLFFPAGGYPIGLRISVKPGMRLDGEAGGRWASLGAFVYNDVVGGGVFWQTDDVVANAQVAGTSIRYFKLRADYPIMLNDPALKVSDSYSGGDVIPPYIMASEVRDCGIMERAAGVGTGITISKTFDSVIEGNEISGFDIGLLVHGSDLNEVRRNRIVGFASYGALEISTGTFGSQNQIEHNDILAGGATSTYIKTCSRHVRVIDNYFETSGCKGFVDISNTDCPQYGTNVPARPLTIVARDNRIDDKDKATDWVYRLQGGAASTVLHDMATSGARAADAKLLVVVGGALPVKYNANYPANYDIRIPESSDWGDFKTGQAPIPSNGITVTAENLTAMSQLNANNAWDYLFYQGEKEFQLTADAVDMYAFLPWSGNSLHPLEVGATYDIYVTASSETGETLNATYLYGDPVSGGTATPLVLTADPTTYYVTSQAAPAGTQHFGVHLTKAATTGTIEVQSIQFVKRSLLGRLW